MDKGSSKKLSIGYQVLQYLGRFSVKTLETILLALISHAILMPHVKVYVLKTVSRQIPSIMPPPDPYIVRLLKPFLWTSFWTLSYTLVSFGVFFAVRYICKSNDIYSPMQMKHFLKQISTLYENKDIETCPSFDISVGGNIRDSIRVQQANKIPLKNLLKAYNKLYDNKNPTAIQIVCNYIPDMTRQELNLYQESINTQVD